MRLFKTLLLLLALALSPAQAYNYSWSTHEDPIAPQPPNNPGECKGSECEGKPDCNRKGSPVYLNTGHFTWEETDISLEGTPLIELNRNYTSHEPRSGLFGNGWISNLERALIKTVYTYPVVATVSSGGSSSNGTVTVVETPTPLVYYVFRHPNGLRYTFKADENGTIQAPKGMFESIETTGSEAIIPSCTVYLRCIMTCHVERICVSVFTFCISFNCFATVGYIRYITSTFICNLCDM